MKKEKVNVKKVSSTKNEEKNLSSARSGDIIDLILFDHKPLKKLIKVMKNLDLAENERREAFDKFAPLLIAHAKPEEQILYAVMKNDKEIRVEAFEGEVEHELAEMMLQEAKAATDTDVWSAKVKVLAELVEHHIQEEEGDLLPDYRKSSEKQYRLELGQKYLDAKEQYENWDFDDMDDRFSASNKSHKKFEPMQHQ